MCQQVSGCFKGKSLKVHIDPNAVSVGHPTWRIPLTIRHKLKSELERMEQADIATKVTEATKGLNSLVVKENHTGKQRSAFIRKI